MSKNVIAFMNMKGGVCKTTLCVNIANTLSTEFQKDVLVIDMDPQFNATQYTLGVVYQKQHMEKYQSFKEARKTVYSLYDDKANEISNITKKENFNGLFNTNVFNNDYLKKDYIVNIKNHLDMFVGDIELINLQITQKSGVENILSNYLEINKLRSKYDYILIDCPPTYSFYFISSYLAADTYIIPLKPDFLSSLGLLLLEKATTEVVKSQGKKIISLGIIYTLIDPRNTIHVPIIEDIERKMDTKFIFDTRIKYLKPIPDGVNTGQFMLDINEQDIRKDIIKITEEFMSRMENII